jgi:hypothetical protein
LWREIPKGTQWFETQIEVEDYDRIRVFPRAQWRKLARGNYSLRRIKRTIESGEGARRADPAFLAKIEDLRNLGPRTPDTGAVILIGVSRQGPLTILDGNHRFVAAMLASPPAVNRFRFYCGVSPRMVYCCWYKTNLSTLSRYGANLLRHLVHDPEKDLQRLLFPQGQQLINASDPSRTVSP